MHGLINRAIQCFVSETYGRVRWEDVTLKAELGFDDFESMLVYDDALTEKVLETVSVIFEKPREALLEDIGTYLVSHPSVEGLRRLLRFGGVSFVEFLHSLDDLPDRARIAVPDLDLPHLELIERAGNRFTLTCESPHAGFAHVLVGLLRAMADDYGALVFLEHHGASDRRETVEITLVETDFAAGRSFDLGARLG